MWYSRSSFCLFGPFGLPGSVDWQFPFSWLKEWMNVRSILQFLKSFCWMMFSLRWPFRIIPLELLRLSQSGFKESVVDAFLDKLANFRFGDAWQNSAPSKWLLKYCFASYNRIGQFGYVKSCYRCMPTMLFGIIKIPVLTCTFKRYPVPRIASRNSKKFIFRKFAIVGCLFNCECIISFLRRY